MKNNKKSWDLLQGSSRIVGLLEELRWCMFIVMETVQCVCNEEDSMFYNEDSMFVVKKTDSMFVVTVEENKPVCL